MDGLPIRWDVCWHLRRWPALGWICLAGLILVAVLSFGACGSGDAGEQEYEAISLSLQIPPSVALGETVPLTLIAKNVSDVPVELQLEGSEEYDFAGAADFVVETSDGVQIWGCCDDGELSEADLSIKTLNPGEELNIEDEWPYTDSEGTPAHVGSYVVRGSLLVTVDANTPRERELMLEAEPVSLEIELGVQPIAVSLQAPSSVRSGDAVPLELTARNVSESPVELSFGGDAQTGSVTSGDFVVTTPDGAQVWRWSGRAFVAGVEMERTLDSGEELVMEGEWDQADAQCDLASAGSYLVRGVLDVTIDIGTSHERKVTLQTESLPLEIEPGQPSVQTVSPSPTAWPSPVPHQGQTLDSDGREAEATAGIPGGFGGMFPDENGVLNVYMLDPDQDQAEAMVNALESIYGADELSNAEVRPIQGTYDFSQLYEWKNVLRREVGGLPGVATLDIDDYNNRLEVGVSTVAGKRGVEERLAGLDIPREAVVIACGVAEALGQSD